MTVLFFVSLAGDLDLVLGEYDGELSYIENTGTSTAPVFVKRTGSGNPFDELDFGKESAPVLADLDGDGDVDLVVGEQGGVLNYLENTVTTPVFVARNGGANPFHDVDVGSTSTPALGDIDGDGILRPVSVDRQRPKITHLPLAGDLDLVVGEEGGELIYLENAGTSTAPVFVQRTGGANPFGGIGVGNASAPALADIDGDGTLSVSIIDRLRRHIFLSLAGDLDLVLGEYDGELSYIENTGTSTAPVFVKRTGSGNPFDELDFGKESAPVLADLDGDGDVDLVVGEQGGVLNYLENTVTTPVFVARNGGANPFHDVDVGSTSTPALGDIDGDGILRPVSVDRQRPKITHLPLAGDLDLVVGEEGGELIYLENAGTSTAPVFVQRTGGANPFGGIGVGNASAPALADIDGDGTLSVSIIDRLRRHIFLSLAGDLDLVVGEEYGQLIYFNNTGNSTTPLFVQRTGGANPFDGIDVGDKSAPTFADLDDDGTVDLVVGVGGYGAESGKIFYYRNVGTPSRPNFEKVDEESPFDQIDLGEDSKPALTDVDGDGTLRPCPYQQRRRITRFCRRRSGPRSWRRRQLAQLLREHRDIYNASI